MNQRAFRRQADRAARRLVGASEQTVDYGSPAWAERLFKAGKIDAYYVVNVRRQAYGLPLIRVNPEVTLEEMIASAIGHSAVRGYGIPCRVVCRDLDGREIKATPADIRRVREFRPSNAQKEASRS